MCWKKDKLTRFSHNVTQKTKQMWEYWSSFLWRKEGKESKENLTKTSIYGLQKINKFNGLDSSLFDFFFFSYQRFATFFYILSLDKMKSQVFLKNPFLRKMPFKLSIPIYFQLEFSTYFMVKHCYRIASFQYL